MKELVLELDEPLKVRNSYRPFVEGVELGYGELRERALSHLEQGFPGVRDEEWKYTNLRSLLRSTFLLNQDSRLPDTWSDRDFLRGISGIELVFVNGRFSSELSRIPDLSGDVKVAPLSRLDQSAAGVGELLSLENRPFAALNSAFFADGVAVIVPDGGEIADPVHMINVTVPGAAVHPRVFIRLGRSAAATVVETYLSAGAGAAFTNPVSEIYLSENSRLDHYVVRNENTDSYHISNSWIYHEANAFLENLSLDFGGNLVRNEIVSILDGEGISSRLDGLFMLKGTQHCDNHTLIEHRKPHCESFELYKGILDDRSRGVFSGKIHVYQDAQKTDSKQMNPNILLSPDARVDTKPQLEIYADDVKCTHGATVGRFDSQSMFYLRSRGLDRQEARRLLIHAFANDIIDRMSIGKLKETLHDLVVNWSS